MKIPDVITIDFETLASRSRPDYPPEPVGVAIKYGSEPSHYYACGHPTGNNCSPDEALAALAEAWAHPAPKLFHNAKFDLAVAEEKLELDALPWDAVHDTMFLAFLADPHSRSVGLKDLAETLLGWAPEERDEVAEWIWDHRKALVEEFGGRITRAKFGESSTGAWIGRAPGDLVGTYACGDVDRTYALFCELYPLIADNGMLEAYDRERRLLPILMENERLGMRVDVDNLDRDIKKFRKARKAADAWLRDALGAPDLNLDADRDVAEALSSAGIVDDDKWTFTASGQRSVSKTNLRPDMYNDPRVASAFGYRNRLSTCLKMFMEPWLEQASARGGVISTNWHQTRGGEAGGTRTGRPSTSSPNFLNLAKSMEGRTDGYEHPEHLGVDVLPLVRRYILPDEDGVFLHRDFDGQELRIFGHFEQGELMRAYHKDPTLDVHAFVGDKMADMKGMEFERTRVKVINFQSIYGGGIPALCRALNISQAEAKEFKAFHDQALPGRKTLNNEITRLARAGEPIRTWGGRIYYPEEPKMVQGRMRTFEYKLLNYLVQGSAADATKEAIIRWHTHPDRCETDRFLVTVYDEINISADVSRAAKAMRVLRECMEGLEFDVPMLSSPKAGWTWGDCVKPEKGESEDAFINRLVTRKAA